MTECDDEATALWRYRSFIIIIIVVVFGVWYLGPGQFLGLTYSAVGKAGYW